MKLNKRIIMVCVAIWLLPRLRLRPRLSWAEITESVSSKQVRMPLVYADYYPTSLTSPGYDAGRFTRCLT